MRICASEKLVDSISTNQASSSSSRRRRRRASSLTEKMTTARLVSAVIMSSVLFSMHHVNTFYTHYLNDVILDRPVDLGTILPSANQLADQTAKQTANQSAMQSLRANLVPTTTTTTDENATNRTTGAATALNDRASTFAAVGLGGSHAYGFKYANDEEEDYPDRKRAIVLISTGEKASNTTLVERFVWSARNIGNYRGWIVLITDADEERYANLAVAAMPTTSNTTTANNRITVTTTRNDRNTNTKNRFLVFRTQENRFARTTRFRKFHDTNTMNSKIFKTYILQYAKKERLLNDIELFYYLDVDIVFGNSIRPLFDDLETRYNIGGGLLQQQQQESVSESLAQAQLSSEKDNTTESAKIYFFEGNGNQEIQGGQIVLDRKTSQVCLDRWRFLMQKQRQKRFLKDQTSLTMILKEQKQRLVTSTTVDAAAISNITDTNSTDTDTDTDTNSTEGGKKKKHCEIVLMKQDKKLIQFPELVDIEKRLAQKKRLAKNQPEYPTLVHFRNSASVMKNVEEETFQLYVRDILRFEEHQKDDLGLLNKMLMQRDHSKKSF